MIAKLPLKFLRAQFVPSISSLESYAWRMKVTYEFWGFCVNGGTDLRNPGGFAAITPFNVDSAFESGSLLLSGSDGQTNVGTEFFSSSIGGFLDSHLGSYVVAWKSGSTSTDDSIYYINKVINSSVVRVNVEEGGTPLSSAQNAPYFTDRTNINFRIVDIHDTATNSFSSGSYMVFQFQAPDINEGQAGSQAKLGYNSIYYEYRWHVSPSGSWNGTAFTDGQETTFSTGNSAGWTVGGIGTGRITMIADKASLFHHGMGVTSTGGVAWHNGNSGGWHIEIPDRIYPKELDPNPMVVMSWGGGMNTTSVTRGGFTWPAQISRDGLLKQYETFVRSPHGLEWDSRIYNGNMGTLQGDSVFGVNHNQVDNSIWMSELFTSRTSADEYVFARSRFRNLRAMSDILSDFQLIGDDPGNQWFSLSNWVLVPWDGARLPRNFVLEF